MTIADYKLGTTLAGITNIESLTTPLPIPRVSEPVYELEKQGNGLYREMGLPSCTWTFPLLSTAELAQLRTFCSGSSAVVYLRTLPKLSALTTYATYKAVLLFPKVDAVGGFASDVVIKFERMEVQS
jgi:hypothetical protein